jgi:DNA-binding winged helix-turn-helix (wHTH) protein/Tol biopolymer transport system component
LVVSEQNQFIYEFGPFRLNAQKRLLLRDGEIVPLKPKAFETLLALVEGSGTVIEKEELISRVWPDTVVEEGNLTFNISSLRKALGDDPRRHEYIVTVPGEGYRFVAGVRAGFNELEVRERTHVRIEEEVETDAAIPDGALQIANSSQTFLKPNASASSELVTIRNSRFPIRVLLFAGGLLCVLLLAIGVWRYKQRQVTIATTRPIPFQQTNIKRLTNLGNALQAALSSDGKLFVHSAVEKDGKHSLWLGHTEGGPSVLLRQPADVVYQYVGFAPDDSSLYFIANESYGSSGILYRMPVLGGVPEKIRENVRSDVAFAPDGKRFAFTRNDRTKRTSFLVIADIEGSSEADVVSRPLDEGLVLNSLAWSADGALIAFAAVNNESGKKQEIFISRIADGTTRQLTASAWAAVYATTWLKDGSGLIVAAKDKEGSLSHLWHVSSADGAVKSLVADLNSYHLRLSMPATSDAVLTVQYQYYSNIWVATANNLGDAKQISFGSLGRVDGVRGFDWTPGGQIVYKAEADQNQTIWSMNAAGGDQKQLLPAGYTNSNLSVSSDGRYVIFESNRSGGSEVWRASMDGSDIRQLTTGGNNSEPHASPAGNWVIYKSRRDDLRALWRISIDGGEPRQLTERSASWPRVSPDGKWVACEYDADGVNKLAIVAVEGGRPVKLFDVPRLTNFSYGVRWTPDSKAVTYHDWANGIWKQALQGGEPLRLEGLPQEKMFGHGWSRDGRLFAFVRGVQIRDVVLISDAR